MNKWYQSEECNHHIIIGGQICMVRNVDNYPFEGKMDIAAQRLLMEAVCYAVREVEGLLDMKFCFHHLSGMDETLLQSLVGELVVSPLMLDRDHDMGLLVSEDETVSILINGKEHICIQVSTPGCHMREALEVANRVDDALNQYLNYAYNDKYGYLTANPVYTGTGMSASCLLHLPYLEEKGLIQKYEKELNQFGFTLRPHFDGQIQAPGSVYRVKNRKTLGSAEMDIIISLEQLTQQLAAQEEKVARHYIGKDSVIQEDKIRRAYGLLKYAGRLEYDETMSFLSAIRLGQIYDIWDTGLRRNIFEMMLNMQQAVLKLLTDRNTQMSDMAQVRAEYIHQCIEEI